MCYIYFTTIKRINIFKFKKGKKREKFEGRVWWSGREDVGDNSPLSNLNLAQAFYLKAEREKTKESEILGEF